MLKFMKQLIILLLVCNIIHAQSDVPLSLRAQFNGPYGYTIIGNTHNEFDNWQTPPPPCEMLTQSSATLNLLPNQNIVAAYLHWSGIGDGTFNPIVNLNGLSYSSNSISIAYPENNLFAPYFGSFVNITSQIQSQGNTLYTFSNIDLNPIIGPYCGNGIYYLGWSIIVVYEQAGLPNVQLNVYDGLNAVNTYFNNGITNLTIDNLNVIDTANAQMTYTAYNGSPNLFFDEFITLNGNTLSNALNPPDNPFNGTNNFTGSTTNWNQDIDTFDIGAFINLGDTNANITFGSAFQRFVQTIVTSIRSELPDATVTINQVTGQEVCGNRDLLVECTVFNTNSNAVLPAVPIAYYANDELVAVQSTQALAVGESVTFTQSILIPSTIPDTFTLEVRADFSILLTGTVAESNENNNTDSQIITLAANTVTPTFTISNTVCQGETVPALPLTSANGITGTWSPDTIDTALGGTYVFTPDPGQCATSEDLTITVTPGITPTFAPIPAFCAGTPAPTLPATSLNGITGTWSPSVISNTTSGTYVFTPNPNQCVTSQPVSLSVTVTPSVTPTFNPIPAFCSGTTATTLPATSLNGVTGTWSPPVISNTTSGTYVFTPNPNQCATSQPVSLSVTVTPVITPTFNPIPAFCSGTPAPTLPATSLNGITGAWSPPVINPTASGTYVFTPNPNQCATSQPVSLSVTVTPSVTPTFNPIPAFCSGTTAPVLPTTSLNGITGSWSPSTINNITSGTYIFTPDPNQCATSQPVSLSVTITPGITPTFNPIPAFCAGTPAPTLPATSLNGITGTWSPPVISNTTSGTYAFTSNPNQCATSQPVSLAVTVTPGITPTFNPIPAFCAGTPAPTLPATSLNGITGTWSPSAINNATSETYVFTPTGTACATPVNVAVTVIPQLIPDFPDLNLCANDTYLLSAQSPNGIVGSWSPAVIDFTSDVSYTFTPDSGQCAAGQTILVTINQQGSTNFKWQASAPFTDNATITVVTDVPGEYLYQLDLGPLQSSNIFQDVTAGVHTIQVIDPDGCADPSVQNNIVILDYPKFFTPNGDGLNETWNISDRFLDSSAQIIIFDRYGKLLTQIATAKAGWDGTINGQPVPATDYWFTINFIYNQQNLQFKSHFSLIR